jgi:hypothetical protein
VIANTTGWIVDILSPSRGLLDLSCHVGSAIGSRLWQLVTSAASLLFAPL